MKACEGPVLITGGTSGIGFGIAKALMSAGRPIAIIGRDQNKCEKAEKSLRKNGEEHAGRDDLLLAASVDTTNQTGLAGFVDKVLERWGRVDGVVTSAGRLARGSLLDLSSDEFTAAWETNVFGTWTAIKAVLPAMLSQHYGRIVTIGSILGTVGAPERGGYAATKGAVAALTRSLALEVAGSGVTANCLAPGPVKSTLHTTGYREQADMSGAIADLGSTSDAATAQFDSGIPLGNWGTPSDIAHFALSLLSPEAGWATGSVIHIDGGYTAR